MHVSHCCCSRELQSVVQVEAAHRELAGVEAGDGRDESNRSLAEQLADAQNAQACLLSDRTHSSNMLAVLVAVRLAFMLSTGLLWCFDCDGACSATDAACEHTALPADGCSLRRKAGRGEGQAPTQAAGRAAT